MNRLFKKYENLILLFALLIFSAVLLSNNARGQKNKNLLERAVLTVVTPPQDAVTNGIRNVIIAWNRYFYLVDTAKENATLRKMFEEQVYKNNMLREELKKYRRVDTLVAQTPLTGTKTVVVAGVSAWDSTTNAKTMALDRGEKDGVKIGMVAMTHLGIIGRIVTVSDHAARVLLITDARSAVDAYVQRTRARCTVVGTNKNTGDVKYLAAKEDTREGDILVSSGLGGVFPAGLQIGRVSSIEPGASKLFARAEMTPTANIEHLEEVLVAQFGVIEVKPETAPDAEEEEN